MKWYKRRKFKRVLWSVFDDPEYEAVFDRMLMLVKGDPIVRAFFLKHNLDLESL